MTTTIALPLLDITSTAFEVVLDAPTPPVATPAGHATNYGLVAVDNTGQRHAEFPQATILTCSWELNGVGEATFSIPQDDPNIGHLPLANGPVTPYREVQIWRNGQLIWWGIPTKRRLDNSGSGSAGTWQYTAQSLMWYFTRRYIGDAERANFLSNPGAETGTAPWVANNCTLTQSTDQHILDAHSFKLSAGHDQSYISQFNLIHSTTIGLALFLAAWVWVDNATYISESYLAKAASLLRYTPPFGPILEERVATTPLNSTIPKNKWVRIETHIWIPPNRSEVIEARLWSPPGCIVYWDAVQLVAMESVAFGGPPPDNGPFDQVSIAKEVVRYSQGQGIFANDILGNNNGKSHLNIGTAGAKSGITQYRVYFLSEHQRIYESGQGRGVLDEWPQRTNGFDYDIAITPASRTFTCYYPRKGSKRNGLALEWGKNVSSYSIEESIDDAANQIVELGDDTGQASQDDAHHTSREEGSYNNPAALGGLTLELVENAPSGSPIDTLDHIAKTRGKVLENGSQIPVVTVFDQRDDSGAVVLQIIGNLDVGDVVPIRIPGVINDSYRIVHMSLDAQSDTMQVSTNLETAGLP